MPIIPLPFAECNSGASGTVVAELLGESPVTPLQIPSDRNECRIQVDGVTVKLSNLQKVFWPDAGFTKRDLLQYYADVAAVLLPHLRGRAMVMKRYPHGITGSFFFMKRAPEARPDWIRTCLIKHASGSQIAFPLVQDLPSLLWMVNLGCIDLNPWYAPCDDVDRPDYLHFDLDPVPDAGFPQVREAALLVRDAVGERGMTSYPKTTGSRGLHVYVPIERGPLQKEVWTFAKAMARELAARYPYLITGEYRVARRPPNRVLVDYNQNAWGRTLASVYSVRPKPGATISAPLTWEEVEQGVSMEDFRLDTMPARVESLGDLFRPLLAKRPRYRIEGGRKVRHAGG
jgi:bifunctional non-homologous end joining protein LigD